MKLFRLLAVAGFALQCSASLLPGTPKPEVEDVITGPIEPWQNDGITGPIEPWQNDPAALPPPGPWDLRDPTALPPPGPWDLRDFELINPRNTPEGEELFESDILLRKDQWEAIRERKAINYEGSRWPEGSDGYPLVPFVYSDSEVDRVAVKAGIDHWMEHTCVKFEETTNANQAHLQFFKGGGCWSYVGLSSSTGQQISIGSGCDSLGTVAHEIGHAMGFFHEQSRTDRDDHVVIKYDNIIEDSKNNFEAHDTNNYDVNYDYSSDMHYGSMYFTKNGKMTIVTKDPFAQELIASRTGLSHRDKLMANKMYKCLDKWATECGLSADSCKNEGYLGAKCACVCPTGVSGTNCETVSADYYAHLRNKETETITAEKTISSVGGSKFTKKIVAPTCKKVKVTFENFELYEKITHNGATYCYYEFVFLRFGNDLTEGDNYCAQDISTGQSFTSETNIMILYSESKYSGISDGWSAKVEFVEDSDCTPPTTSKPTTSKPTTSKPTTSKPTTSKPTTSKPANTAPTTSKPATLVKCAKKTKTQKLKAGDAIEIQSSNYPNNYSSGKCLWKFKGDGAENVKVSCTNFDLEAVNKKGKCKDFLMIGGKKYCGDSGPVEVIVSIEKLAKLRFKANKKKFGKGFSCTVTALSDEEVTTTALTTEIITTAKPTTAKPTTAKSTTAKPTEDPNRCRCGQVKASTRIINGAETEAVEYPWQAGIVSTNSARTRCGGSLINSNWVLTAAHCTVGKSASSIQVLLAEHDVTVSESHTERFSLKQIINHPDYGTYPWTSGHDVSLLELDGKVNFETSQARPICLPTGDSTYAGTVATLTGFGRTGYNQPQSNYLREVDIDVITTAQCTQYYGGSAANYNTMICAGKSDGTGGCMGDSGGPLITKENNYHVQIGVVSFGSSKCDSYGVFARVTDLKDWITSNTNSGNPDTCSP